MLTEDGLAWLATELACEVNRQNCEKQMSINNLRESLSHIPGGKDLTMRYGKGGLTQIFTIDDKEIELGPDATAQDIEDALKKKLSAIQ